MDGLEKNLRKNGREPRGKKTKVRSMFGRRGTKKRKVRKRGVGG
jgi:hypothetical protein